MPHVIVRIIPAMISGKNTIRIMVSPMVAPPFVGLESLF
jgi:hypothetical protein